MAYKIPQIPTVITYPRSGDAMEFGNPNSPANPLIDTTQKQSAQIDTGYFPTINLAVTGLTGGGTNLDNVPTVGRKIPSGMFIVVSGSGQLWILQTSSATPGTGVVEPLDNSALRWIQAI